MMIIIRNFLQSEKGAATMEYALLASLIAMAIIAITVTLGNQLCGLFTNVAAMLIGVVSNGNASC